VEIVKSVSDLVREDNRTVPMEYMKGGTPKGEVMSDVGRG